MTREDILKIVKEYIRLMVDQENILEEELLDHIGLDSLDQVELFMMLEKEFKINIEDSQIVDIKTVGQTVDAILKSLPQAA